MPTPPSSTIPPPAADSPDADATPRVIGPWAAWAIVAGSMLGVGIFLMPGKVALEVPGLAVFIAVWLVGGLFALSGSVACGELGAMLPRAGGDYVFQREAFGPSLAFASGWVLFGAIFSGSIASLTVAVFQYDVGPLLGVAPDVMTTDLPGLPFSPAQLAGIGLILLLTFLNDLGARVSGWAQTLLTLTPIAAMVLLALWILLMAPDPVAPLPATDSGATELTLAGLAAAFLFVNFAFSGWLNIIYVASEVKDPGKNVPRSMIWATLSVTALYLLMCLAFLAVLGFAGLAASGAMWLDGATAVATVLADDTLRTIGLLIITVAIVTSINATILASARVGYAMAKDGAFWRGAAKLSGRQRVPRRALWIQAAISSVLVLSGTFDEIIAMTSVAMFVTGTLTVGSLFVLRRTRPALPRPYRATGYPLFPALYIALALFTIGATVWKAFNDDTGTPWFPLIGVAVLLVTWIGHLLYTRHAKRAAGVVAGVLLLGLTLGQLAQPGLF